MHGDFILRYTCDVIIVSYGYIIRDLIIDLIYIQ